MRHAHAEAVRDEVSTAKIVLARAQRRDQATTVSYVGRERMAAHPSAEEKVWKVDSIPHLVCLCR